MVTAKIVREFEWTEDRIAVSLDFDAEGRVCALYRNSLGRPYLEIDDFICSLPEQWTRHVEHICWLSTHEVLVWPIIASPRESQSDIGRISARGHSSLNVGYPLNLYTHRTYLACTYPEDQIYPGEVQSKDFVSILLMPSLDRVADLLDHLKDDEEFLLEVETAVLDGDNARFWFTGYVTEYLWCFSFKNFSVMKCPLHCRREEILAITCDNQSASILLVREDTYKLQTYRRDQARIYFESESSITLDDGRILTTTAVGGPITKGYANNMIAIKVGDHRAILLSYR